MKKIALLVLVTMLTISVEGCSSGSDDRETTPSPNSSKSLVDKAQNTKKQENKSQEEKEPEIINPQRFSGLIPATNPDVRVSGSIRGRIDPFALVKIQPQIEIIKTEEEENGEVRPPISRPTISRPTITTPDSLTSTPTINDLDDRAKNSEPPIMLAKNVLVSGIVELNGATKVIVKAPEEDTARYVDIGQYLSNGKILVKRIEGINTPTPKVVLVQNGTEITKAVGELPTAEDLNTNEQPTEISDSWVPNFLSQKLQDSKNN